MIVSVGLWMWGAAIASEPPRVGLALGYAGVGASGAAGGADVRAGGGAAGVAYLGVRVLDRLWIDVGGREGVVTGDLRVVGTVQVAARGRLGRHAFLRGGFVHHHEAPWEGYTANVLAATFGSWEGIRHRSGADLGVGLSWDLPTGSAPLSTSLEASVIAFPDALGPPLYGVVQHLVTFHFEGADRET